MKSHYCAVMFALASLPAFLYSHGLEDAAFLHYQNCVQCQPTGVYEFAGVLYVQVKLPFDSRKGGLKRKEIEARLVANDLIRDWAIDYSRPERERRDPAPNGVKFAKGVAATYFPEWQFREWDRSFRVREYPPEVQDGFCVLGQIVLKEDVVRSIPNAFFEPYAKKDWAQALTAAVNRGVQGVGREDVVARCEAWDALRDASSCTNVDYLAVSEAILSYLKESDLSCRLRKSQKNIEDRIEREYFELSDQNVEITTNEVVVVQTNLLNDAKCEESSFRTVQRKEAMVNVGRSLETMIDVSQVASNIEQIVETRSITVTTARRCVRKMIRRTECGQARFEKMFLSGGIVSEQSAKRTRLGAAATKEYYAPSDLSRKMVLLEDALRENPFDAGLWNLYGKCLAASGDSMGSVICFRVALRLDCEHEFALVNLAEAYSAIGYEKLSFGLATYARAIAKDRWCIEHAEAVLSK